MKTFARIIVLALLCGLPLIIRAQELPHTVSFDGVSFAFDSTLGTSVTIHDDSGDAIDVAKPNGAQPPHLEFLFYDDDNPPSRYQTDTRLLVYGVADVVEYEAALEPLVYNRFEALAALVTDQRDLRGFEVGGSDPAVVLPHLPVILMPQMLRARVEYFETDTLKGIRYLTAFPDDIGRPLVTGDFTYAFMALSKNGSLMVAGSFGVAPQGYLTTWPPEDAAVMSDFYGQYGGLDAFEAVYDDYASEQVTVLNAMGADDFVPSLAVIDALMESIETSPIG